MGYKEIIKKVFILCLVAVAFQLNRLMGTAIVRIAVIGFYISMESLSILEYATKAGLKVRPALTEALGHIKGRKEIQI